MAKKLKRKIYKVVIGIPNEGVTKPESYDNHLVLAFHLGALQERLKRDNSPVQYEFYWHTVGRLLTPYARERLTESAIKIGADFMIQFDDDMLLPIDMVECMLQDMEERPEIDVLGALAFMRNAPHLPVMYTVNDGYDSHSHRSYFLREVVKDYPKDKIVECDAVGFGAACIRMSILETMQEPYFMSTTAQGEDIFFCWKAKKAGAKIFMDTRIKLGHLSNPISIDEAYYEKYRKEHPEV